MSQIGSKLGVNRVQFISKLSAISVWLVISNIFIKKTTHYSSIIHYLITIFNKTTHI